MSNKRKSILPAAVVLLLARLLMEISFIALGTAAAWGYPAPSWRPMAGLALGLLVSAAAFRMISGTWHGAAQAARQAAAVAGIVLFFLFAALLLFVPARAFGLRSTAVLIAAGMAVASWFRVIRRRAAGERPERG
jgi:Na+-transporting NADH:ubiquinone oxidoreductase subunit NqrB